nr:uncharacterized protein LOC123283815 [Equus asinus]
MPPIPDESGWSGPQRASVGEVAGKREAAANALQDARPLLAGETEGRRLHRVLQVESSPGGLKPLDPSPGSSSSTSQQPGCARSPLTLSQRRRGAFEFCGTPGTDARPRETWVLQVSGQTPRRPGLKRRFVFHLIQQTLDFPEGAIPSADRSPSPPHRAFPALQSNRSPARPVAILRHLVVVGLPLGPQEGPRESTAPLTQLAARPLPRRRATRHAP